MAGLMDGYGMLLFVGKDFGPFFQTAYYAVDGVDEVLALYDRLVVACGYESGLIAHVGYVGARESRSLAGEQLDVEPRLGLDLLQVYVEYRHSVVKVGQIHVDLTVESACARKALSRMSARLVAASIITPLLEPESVHLGEQLVRVFSRSSLAPMLGLRPRARPTASISSINTIQGDFSLA